MPKPLAANGAVTSAFLNDLVGVIDRSPSSSAIDVVSTAAETTVYSKAVAANAMSTDRLLRCTLVGDYLNNTGGAATLTPRIYFGGAAWFGHTRSMTASATRNSVVWQFWLANLSAANKQFAAGLLDLSGGGPSAGSVAGVEDGSVLNTVASAGTLAIDTTSAQTFAITVQHGSSSASLSFRKWYAVLELL